jgi:hypothetical protein
MSSKNEKKKGVADGTQNTALEGVPTHQPTGLGAVAGEIGTALPGSPPARKGAPSPDSA